MNEKKFCKFCGKQIDKSSIVCPNCGRQLEIFSSVSQSVNDEIGTHSDSLLADNLKKDNRIEGGDEQKFYTKNWFMWLMLIIFPPIGIFLIWKFHKQMQKNTKIMLTIVFGIIFLFELSNSGSSVDNNYNSVKNDDNSTIGTDSTDLDSKDSKSEDFSNVETVYELSDGHYTAGIDLPIGKCNVIAINGNGNVSSSNMYSGGLNAMMGVSDNNLYSSTFNGLSMDKKVVLSVSNGVTIRLEYTKITGNYSGRIYDEASAFELGDGNYTVGIDLNAGIYNVIAVSGNGNVSSSNMYDGGLNAMMGVDGSELYSKEYKNITLRKNDTLSVMNGVVIKLIPVK